LAQVWLVLTLLQAGGDSGFLQVVGNKKSYDVGTIHKELERSKQTYQ